MSLLTVDPTNSSLPGLTRQSIIRKQDCSFMMDARVKPAHDEPFVTVTA
jgi:hypothetical protein